MAAMAKDIRGLVMDKDSISIEFANIIAFDNDSVVGYGTTDASGLFRIDVGNSCDSVRVSYVGYDATVISPVETDLGRIILNQPLTTLKEVVVKAPLIRREADRVILNIAANPLAANKDAQQLLKTAPGVWATDETLSIYGQGGTTIYVDDRKINMSGTQLMTYLKSIQSASIATIEVIPKGGAEYSADSSGGIIRINLRRNRVDGVNGSAGINVTGGEYKQWLNPFVNLSMHSGKWTLNLNGNVNGSPTDRYITHEESTNMANSQELTGESHHKGKSVSGNLLLGVFYEPSARDKIGLQLDWNPGRSRHTSESRTTTYSPGFRENTSGRYVSDDHAHNFDVAFNWSHSIDEKGSVLKLVSNYNYQNSSVDEDNKMCWPHLQRDSVYRTCNSNRYNIFVAELSVFKMFNQKWNLNAGGKYTFNDVAYKSFHQFYDGATWIQDNGYDYDTSYDENIAALYAIMNGQAGRWRFKVGLRGEYFNTTGSKANHSRFDIFPNANVSYNLTDNGKYTVALGYYRNVGRPSFWSLNPVVRQVSDYSYTIGNPDLTPSFTDAISLDFVLNGRFTIATGYSETRHPIKQMFTSNPEYPERMYLTWGNLGNDRNGFIHADGFINITKWWNLYSSITYVVTSQKLSAAAPFETFGYIQLVASTTFQLPKGYNLTMNCFYNSKMKIGNITVYPIFNLNPTLQKRFGKHWSVSIGVENMLQRESRIRTSSAEYDRLSYTKNYATVKIGVTYNFNTGKIFKSPRIEKNTDNSRLSKE